ncbi:MAG: hypothetical protein JSV44_07430, partial [Candidatus Zixiibacteriota bacterium]
FYRLGRGYQKLKKLPEAIAALSKSTELKNDYFNSFNSLGQIYQAQENYMKAYQMFRTAIRIKPDNYLAHRNLAISFEHMNLSAQGNIDDIDQVIANWNKFLKVAKNNPRAKRLISETEEHIKDLQELKEYQQEEL